MSNLILFSVLFLFLFSLFFVTFKSFMAQFYIRKKLKKELKNYRAQIQQAKGYNSLLFEIYKRIYEQVIYDRNRFLIRNRRQFERQVNNELKRMTKNPFTRFYSKSVATIKGLSAFAFFLASLLFGAIVVDEYKASSLTLPTVNPEIKLQVSGNIEDGFKQLVSTILSSNELKSFELPDIQAEDIVPIYPTQDAPASTASAAQLGPAIAGNMRNLEAQFTIQYEGNIQNFDEDLENAYEWLEKNEPYFWAIMSDFSTRAIGNERAVELQATISYDLTAEQNALVLGKIKQVSQSLSAGLTDAEKVKFVNDYLVSQTKYNAQSAVNPHTPYAILFHGEGVCEGYALAAYLMLEELGVEAKYVVGDAGGPHAWNLVKVDNAWYHLDTTWNDPLPDQGKNIRYDYFLISDKTIAKNHQWDTTLYPATATEDYL